MYKKLLVSLFVISVGIGFVNNARAELDARARAMVLVTSYGVGGGTLLGLASMAFGTKWRAVAVGASLGLYTGLIFGTYIVISHEYMKTGGDVYPDSGDGPYGDEEGDEYEGDVGAPTAEYSRSFMQNTVKTALLSSVKEKEKNAIYINLVRIQF